MTFKSTICFVFRYLVGLFAFDTCRRDLEHSSFILLHEAPIEIDRVYREAERFDVCPDNVNYKRGQCEEFEEEKETWTIRYVVRPELFLDIICSSRRSSFCVHLKLFYKSLN